MELSGNRSSTSTVKCRYCQSSEPVCLARCNECSRWYCNNRAGSMGSHIVIHLAASGHSRICLHPENSFKQGELSCYKCHSSSVFALCTEDSQEIICRGSCFDENRGQPTTIQIEQEITSLIQERMVRPDILPFPQRPRHVSINEIEIIEGQDQGDAKFEIRMRLRPMPTIFQDVESYQKLHNDLISIQVSYEYHKLKDARMQDVRINWTVDGNMSLGSFKAEGQLLNQSLGMLRIFNQKTFWETKAMVLRTTDGVIRFRLKPGVRDATELSLYTVEALPNLSIYNRQTEALTLLPRINRQLKETILAQEKSIQSRESSRPFQPLPQFRVDFRRLNDSQKNAIVHAIYDPLTLIQGPPGTGKTSVATNIIKYKLALDPNVRILACAPSNTATDNIAERLGLLGVEVLRLCAKSKPETLVPHLTLDAKIRKLEDPKYAPLKALQQKIDNKSGLTYQEEKKHKELMSQAESEVLSSARVVCCTCSTVNDGRLAGNVFKFVLIDEATQSVEPETLCAITHGAEQLVLIGDKKQLGPTVQLKELQDIGLSRSLYERLLSVGNHCIMLDEQYRMHPVIAEYSNSAFYDGNLQTRVTVADRTDPDFSDIWVDSGSPIMFCDIWDNEEISDSGTSYLNRFEYVAVEHFLCKFYNEGLPASDVGVITFYDGQVKEIKRRLEVKASEIDRWYGKVEVKSVDGYQGREKKYIILSCVRSNSSVGVGFINDERRMNVALTRAQYGLILVGNSEVLRRASSWKDLIGYYERRGLITPFEQYRGRRPHNPPSSRSYPNPPPPSSGWQPHHPPTRTISSGPLHHHQAFQISIEPTHHTASRPISSGPLHPTTQTIPSGPLHYPPLRSNENGPHHHSHSRPTSSWQAIQQIQRPQVDSPFDRNANRFETISRAQLNAIILPPRRR